MSALRCVGYVKPMDPMEAITEEKRIMSIPADEQKKHILAYAAANGFTVAEIYAEKGSADFKRDEAFKRMRDDAIHRKIDLLILDSVYCFGPGTYMAVDILVNVFFPAGIRFVVIEDDFISEKKTFSEVRAYGKAAVDRYRSRQAMLTIALPERVPVAPKFERKDQRPECILNLFTKPENVKTGKMRRGTGHSCYAHEHIQRQLHALVSVECQKAEYAKSRLADAIHEKARILEPYIQETNRLWDETDECNQRLVTLHYAWMNEEITEKEYADRYAECMKSCEETERQYRKCRADMREIERLFDTENRWIKRFTMSAVPERFDHENAVRWFDSFDIIDGKVENAEFEYWEWREALPDVCKKTVRRK